jgi:hypothetical protein
VKSILRRRPSPALVISCIALFVSLGGVSYGVATGFIDSREIKNNQVRSSDLRNNSIRTFDIRNNEVRGFDIRNSSVQGRDVALNTLTGADVSEEDLAKVPSATAADTATTAASVGGVTLRPFAYAGQAGTGFVEVFDFGGLRVEASCDAEPALVVRANPAVANSEFSTDIGTFSNDDLDFDPGDNATLVDAVNAAGQASFAAPDGRMVTVKALTRQQTDDVRGTSNDCGFFGIAEAGTVSPMP